MRGGRRRRIADEGAGFAFLHAFEQNKEDQNQPIVFGTGGLSGKEAVESTQSDLLKRQDVDGNIVGDHEAGREGTQPVLQSLIAIA